MLSFAMVFAVVAHIVFALLSLRLIVIDVRERRLPNFLVGWGSCAVGLLLICSAWIGNDWSRLGAALIAALAYGALLCVLWLLVPGGIGAGDVKLAPIIGAMAGWAGAWVAALWVPLFIALFGGIAGAVALARHRKELPFGPVMIAACWVSIALSMVSLAGVFPQLPGVG